MMLLSSGLNGPPWEFPPHLPRTVLVYHTRVKIFVYKVDNLPILDEARFRDFLSGVLL